MKKQSASFNNEKRKTHRKKAEMNLFIKKIELENIRCFKKLTLNFENKKGPVLWAMILGDNAAGKTTLLRSISLGLCEESDAIGLMKKVKGSFVRNGAKNGKIIIFLGDLDDSSKSYQISTQILKTSGDEHEIVRKETIPKDGFPWSNIFLCGYGTNRSVLGDVSYTNYNVYNAVGSLFDYKIPLQNPEIILLRYKTEIRNRMEDKLLKILMLDENNNKLGYLKSGLELKGPWGKQPFSELSDGYRSTAQWVLDFIAWSIYAERFIDSDIGGILLIDEIEQHLHPRWQRYIVQRLRHQFPQTQIIASTHTPLTASGVVDVENSLLFRLELNDVGDVIDRIIDRETLAGKRADQVLTSDAFGLVTSRNPGSEDDIDRYAELLGKKTLTTPEKNELRDLEIRLGDALNIGENDTERKIEKTIDAALKRKTSNISFKSLDSKAKKQLREIFKSEDAR